MFDRARALVELEYGSINRLAKAINVAPGDLYQAFNGKRPMFPKWRRLIAEALGEAEAELFAEDMDD